jgi:predicted TIM-barrel enzyme/AraC-like DNA-binding protein
MLMILTQAKDFISSLRQKLLRNKKIIMAGVGSGLTARLSEEAEVDAIMVHSAGILRNQGRSSLGSFFPFFNTNQVSIKLYLEHIQPVIDHTPVIVGLFGSDPTSNFDEIFTFLKDRGVLGILNYPSVSLIDGQFREALEENDLGLQKEARMLKLAKDHGFVTVAFVAERHEAELMMDHGADMISVHLGLTTGGRYGAKKAYSLIDAKDRANAVMDYMLGRDENVIRLLAGGAILTHNDLQFMYQNTPADGFIGGSSFERWPVERSVSDTLALFNATTSLSSGQKSLEYHLKKRAPDPVQLVKNYVAEHYQHSIAFSDLCKLTNTSRTYLSSLFSNSVGMSFRDYLINYRMNVAAELLQDSNLLLSEVAELVSYYDYPQFSKMFKKHYGVSPTQYRTDHLIQ